MAYVHAIVNAQQPRRGTRRRRNGPEKGGEMQVLDIADQAGGNGPRWNPAEALPKSLDLRRRRQEGDIDVLLRRAEALPKQDRLVLQSILRDGKSSVLVAGLLETKPRAIRRRTKRLIARLVSHEFLFVLRESATWPPTRRRVAEACVVEGKSARQASTDLRITFHSVRRHLETIAHDFELANPGRLWNAPPGFFRALQPLATPENKAETKADTNTDFKPDNTPITTNGIGTDSPAFTAGGVL